MDEEFVMHPAIVDMLSWGTSWNVPRIGHHSGNPGQEPPPIGGGPGAGPFSLRVCLCSSLFLFSPPSFTVLGDRDQSEFAPIHSSSSHEPMSLHQTVSLALELDSRGDHREAYYEYQRALIKILNSLQDSPSGVKGQELFTLAQNCLDRLKDLAGTVSCGDKAGGPEEDDYYLQFASEPSSRRVSGRGHPLPSSSVPTAGVISPVRASSLDNRITPRGSPIKYPSSYATASSASAQRTGATSLPQSTTENVNLNLSAFRRAHESELVARQKEKTERLLRARASPLARNEEFVSDLLRRRQNLLSTFNERLGEVYASLSARATNIRNGIEAELRRRGIRSSLQELALRGPVEVAIIEPILEVLASPTDPIGQLVRDFVQRCRQQLRQHPDLDRIFDEISLVEHHLVDLIIQTADEEQTSHANEESSDLSDPSLRASVRISIQNFFFSTPLAPALVSALHQQSLGPGEEKPSETILLEGAWCDLFATLKVRTKLQLPRSRSLDAFPIRDAGIYTRAVDELRAISTHWTPYEKLLCLMRSCNSICQAIDEYRREPIDGDRLSGLTDDASPTASSSVGSEDLLLLASYVIVRAAIPDLSSQLVFISRLIPEELIRGEAGYVLATIQTSLDYALSQLGP